MIFRCIRFIREDPRLHRPVGKHRVDVVVHRRIRVIALERPEREVIVPRDHRQLPILLIEIIVVDHRAGVAIPVDHKIVDDEIAQHLVRVEHIFQVLIGRQLFQRRNQPLLIRLRDVRLRVVEDVRVAVRVVVDVLQLHILAAHAAARPAVPAECHALRHRRHFAVRPLRHFPGNIGPLSTIERRAVRIRRRRAALSGCGQFRRRFRRDILRLTAVELHIVHVEALAVAAPAAEAHAVRLVKLARSAVIPFEERILHALDRQIQPEVLAVDRDVHE